MTISKIYADVLSGAVSAANADYETARAGTSPSAALATGANSSSNTGQSLAATSYTCYETLLSFDTSQLDPNAHISSVVLNIVAFIDASVVDFVAQARLHDFDTTIEGADFVPGASLSSKLLLATLDTSLIVSSSAYIAFSESGLNFVNSINRAGKTRIVICSSRMTSDLAPDVSPNTETIAIYTVKPVASFSGLLRQPYLIITDDGVRPPGSPEFPDVG